LAGIAEIETKALGHIGWYGAETAAGERGLCLVCCVHCQDIRGLQVAGLSVDAAIAILGSVDASGVGASSVDKRNEGVDWTGVGVLLGSGVTQRRFSRKGIWNFRSIRQGIAGSIFCID
jgi:hypothetical protein